MEKKSSLLVIDKIDAHYGGIQALREVSLYVDRGEIVALIGANGAGKTTLLNVISGILKPTKGNIYFDGKEISGTAPNRVVEMGIGQVPEGRLLFGPLSVRENLELGAYTRLKRKEDIEGDIERIFSLFPILKHRIDQSAGTLSGGEQQMLAIARGLMGKPKLMLLDEPSLGLAPLVVKEIFNVISRLNEEGTTILLVEQNARAALRIAHRAYVMEIGEIRLSGPASSLMEDKEVIKAYLGGR